MARPHLFAGMVLLTALAGCTGWGSGPDIAGATANGVTVRYNANKVSATEADEAAASYCRGLDKQANLRDRFASTPEMTYADYGCAAGPADH